MTIFAAAAPCKTWPSEADLKTELLIKSRLVEPFPEDGFLGEETGVLPIFGRLLKAGGMFYREGSGALTLCYVACGRLIGCIEVHINSWDCLGALAVIRAAGLGTNDFLADDGLHAGNRLIAGNDAVYAALERVYGTSTPPSAA